VRPFLKLRKSGACGVLKDADPRFQHAMRIIERNSETEKLFDTVRESCGFSEMEAAVGRLKGEGLNPLMVQTMVRPERFELPTFWFVAVNSLLILRNLRAERRATDPSNVPYVPKLRVRPS